MEEAISCLKATIELSRPQPLLIIINTQICLNRALGIRNLTKQNLRGHFTK